MPLAYHHTEYSERKSGIFCSSYYMGSGCYLDSPALVGGCEAVTER